MSILNIFKRKEEKWVQWKYLRTEEDKKQLLDPGCRHDFMDNRQPQEDSTMLEVIFTCDHCNGKKTKIYRRIV